MPDSEITDSETKDIKDLNVGQDHLAPKGGLSSSRGLTFPFKGKPDPDHLIEVAEGVLWARIPIPWSLNHINVYLFDEGDSWSVVDTGSYGDRGIEAWEHIIANHLDGKKISRVIATHLHPDHLGLAGWLVEKFDAEFLISMGEYFAAQTLWLNAAEKVPDSEMDYLFRAGVDRAMEETIQAVGYSSYKKGVYQLPPTYERLEDGKLINLGGRRFITVIGRGHSPEHACLYCLDEPLFISGDQVLPGITSNVSVFAREPNGNPLAYWLASLHRIKQLPGDPLVLPSHGRVFKGLGARVDELIKAHQDKLKDLNEFCSKPRNVVETFPTLYKREITGFDFFMGLGEAMAHMNLLISLGVMERISGGDVDLYKTTKPFVKETVVDEALALSGVALKPLSLLHDMFA